MFLKKRWERLLKKGDKLLAKNKVERAIKCYRKALKYNPDSEEIYSKLISTRQRSDKEWSQCDFLEFMEWTLAQEKILNPKMKHVHAKLSPEWKDAWSIAVTMLSETDDDEAARKIDILVSKGETGTRVLADLLRQIACKAGNDGEAE